MKTWCLLFLMWLFYHVGTAQYLANGSTAIDFSSETEQAQPVKLSSWQGKYVLLEFTATNCGPCWESYPHLNELQKKFEGKLIIATLHEDTLKTVWKKRAEALNIKVNWISLWNVEGKKSIFKEYKINGWPVFYLIDPKGKIVYSTFGYRKKNLDKLLTRHITL